MNTSSTTTILESLSETVMNTSSTTTILESLSETVTKTAKNLGFSRQTFYRKMKSNLDFRRSVLIKKRDEIDKQILEIDRQKQKK